VGLRYGYPVAYIEGTHQLGAGGGLLTQRSDDRDREHG
jgi:hypothetical protein